MTTTSMTIEELAPRTEDEVRAHLAAGKLVEGLEHMSPQYLAGIREPATRPRGCRGPPPSLGRALSLVDN